MLAAERTTAGLQTSPLLERTFAWKEILAKTAPFLHDVSQSLADQAHEFDPRISSFAGYALDAQGKQLRPMLVCLSAESVGNLNHDHQTIAIIIETIHLATLIHDDVIDEADLRRGKVTVGNKWGNEMAVLLGDCLFAHALKLAATFLTNDVCRAVASASNTVCSGEILQTRSRGNFEIERDYYFKVLAMKTAELFALSCDMGGFLGQATAEQRQALRQYGMNLGVAYQLYDDCLDLLGSERMAGKTIGADLARGKMTLPLLIVRDRATVQEREQLRQWVQNWTPALLPDVMRLIHQYDALGQSRSAIQNYLVEARNALAILPDNDGRAGLLGLTQFLAQQTEALGVV